VKVGTRVRISQDLLNHTHGRSKETVELDTQGPSVLLMSEPLFKAPQEMRDRASRTKESEFDAGPEWEGDTVDAAGSIHS